VDAPLALCDGSRVAEFDVVCVDHIRQYYIGETAYLLPRKKNRWRYLSNQRPEEVTLIKIFDSDPKVEAKCTSSIQTAACSGGPRSISAR